MAITVHVGALAPEALTLKVTPSNQLPDLSTVTSATIDILKPDGNEVTWTAALSEQSASGITLTHLYDAGDIDNEGQFVARGMLVAPAGVFRCEPKAFDAISEYAVIELPNCDC